MSLEKLGREYRMSAIACRRRAEEIRQMLRAKKLSETEMMRLRRRYNLLIEMAAESSAVGTYLINYYGRKDDEGNDRIHAGDGVSKHAQPDEVCGAGGRDGAAAGLGTEARTDGAAGADRAHVLSQSAADARDRKCARNQCVHGEPFAEILAREAAPLSALHEPKLSAS